MANSYLSPKLEVRNVFDGQYGIFAISPIKAGEILCIWAGRVRNTQEFMDLTPELRERSIQIEEDFFLVPFTVEDADFVNHSCDPNAGLSGHSTLIAMRDIEVGDHVCFDYAMSDASPYDEFECQCGSYNCRKRVTGDDWKLPDIQKRYKGYFSPYIQRRIDTQSQEDVIQVEVESEK